MEVESIGILALCGTMLGVLVWIIKYQAKIISNDLRHIKSSLDSLPCNRGAGCLEEIEDILDKLESKLKKLPEGEQ